ncbi:MAG: DUF2029 domain-containing protein [Anaerolineae bacterium]|nr:DUF2029 domain-containing protein [Anaerolineae bacterium]
MSNYTRPRPWLLVLILTVIYLGVIFVANDADPKVFVTLGECYSVCAGNLECEVPDDADAIQIEGYDGQFAYYLARDPNAAPPCLDVPAYRAQRMLLPALGRVLSAGQTTLIPWAFVIVNLIALAGSTALLEDLLIALNVSRWYALTYGLFVGVVMAVRLSTTETLAYGLVIAGLWFGQRNRLWQAAIMFALAGLAKETTGLFTAGYLLYFALNRRWWAALRMSLIVGVPFLIWQIVLYDWLGEFGLSSGGAKATPFEIIPYAGLFKIATEGSVFAFLILAGLLFIPAAVGPSLWALWHSIRDLRNRKWDLYPCLLFTNAAIMPFVPFSTYREPLGMFRFIPGLVLMVVLYTAQRKMRRPLLYSTLWIVLILFIVSG